MTHFLVFRWQVDHRAGICSIDGSRRRSKAENRMKDLLQSADESFSWAIDPDHT
jgi:hypothetical protein